MRALFKSAVPYFSLFCYFQVAFAGTTGPDFSSQDYLNRLKQGHIALQLGFYWRSESNGQYIYIDSLIGDRYTVSQTSPRNGLAGIGYFVDGGHYSHFDMSYGVNWFYLSKTRTSGFIFQENQFRNLAYAYHITQYPLYAVAKSTIDTVFSGYQISLNAGIGPNFMQTGGYRENSILTGNNVVSIPGVNFSGKTTTVFSATAGAGVQVAEVFGKAPLNCGYQFFYLGQGKFNVLNDQIQNTLKTGQLYANAVMCSILV